MSNTLHPLRNIVFYSLRLAFFHSFSAFLSASRRIRERSICAPSEYPSGSVLKKHSPHDRVRAHLEVFQISLTGVGIWHESKLLTTVSDYNSPAALHTMLNVFVSG